MPDRSGDVISRVLVVEADPTVRNAVVDALHSAGYATTAAATTSDGLTQLDETNIDAVVSAQSLPDGEGLELYRAVTERYGDRPFILVADSVDVELTSAALDYGIDGLVDRSADGAVPGDLVERLAAAIADHQAAHQLERIRERHELVGRAAVEAFWDRDIATEHVARSRGFEEAFGYQPDEIEEVFDWWAKRIHLDDRAAVLAEVDRALEAGETEYQDTYRFRMGDGSYGHVIGRGVIVYDNDEPVRMVGTLTNATDIVEERERFRAILEQSADLVTVFDEDGRMTYVSQAVTAILGYDPAALVGERLSEYVHPDDRATVDGAFTELVEETVSPTGYLRFRARHADGSWRWLEPLATGRIQAALDGGVVTIRDVTAQVEDEQRLTRSETILQTLPDGVYTTEDGRFTTLNGALAELLGGEVSSLEGARASEFIVPEDRERSSRLRERLHAGELDIVEVEFDIVGLDGTRRRVENRFTRLPGTNSRGTAGVVRDITERTERENAIQRQNDRLEEFSAVLSHDLRNPLTVALGSLELAAEDRDDEHLARLGQALERMDRLIDHLRRLARADRDITDPEPIPLAPIVEEAWAMAGDDAAVLRADDDLGAPVCDRERTRTLFENLFANAVIHAGPTVIVTVGRLDDGFFVADNGPGIPDADRDTVFATGYTTSGDGTGLGLDIVRTVAGGHGWNVSIGDAEDGGARFEFTDVEFDTRMAAESRGGS